MAYLEILATAHSAVAEGSEKFSLQINGLHHIINPSEFSTPGGPPITSPGVCPIDNNGDVYGSSYPYGEGGFRLVIKGSISSFTINHIDIFGTPYGTIYDVRISEKAGAFSTTDVNICGGESFWGHTASGTYIDTLVSVGGCDSIRTLNLLVNSIKSTTIDTAICAGLSFFAAGVYQNASGTYKDTFASITGCDSIVTTNLTVHPKAIVNFGQDRNLCFGDSILLNPGLFKSYQWQDQSIFPTFKVIGPGVYYVKVTDKNGCTASDSISIKNIVPLPSNFLKSPDSICQYQTLNIGPVSNFASYMWSTGSVKQDITIASPGQYSLTVKDTNGCQGSDTINVYLKYCHNNLFIPTAFTPNGDNLNDIFKAVINGSAISFQLRVYNRLGQMIFTTADPKKGWNGKLKGIDVEPGIFVWQCSYQLQGGDVQMQKGIVTLIR